jgi:hypothetical protein
MNLSFKKTAIFGLFLSVFRWFLSKKHGFLASNHHVLHGKSRALQVSLPRSGKARLSDDIP